MAVILCYGDSNTHGTAPLRQLGDARRWPPGQRWPDALAAGLGLGHHVLAEGLPGRTTVHDDPVEGGMRNGLTVLPAILHSHKPVDLLILMLGTNDLKHRFSVTAFEIARSVERLALLARAEIAVPDILLVAPAPVREIGVLRDVFAGAEPRQVGLAGHLSDAAKRLGCGFVAAGDTVAVAPEDGVHWDAEAHRAFGEVMARHVADRLP
ncbi:SGNH/GDSL hydrolase family protein [Pseudoponticoccus marisrubri]|uniref:GDSL family lipase n=1 Tax=Pseudoponticoccus marisrubri TaxID=1685382 RepID=A0A0W7WM15_9RHOB|nr:SGNH/GDSL hydrolase family protein [Pseudoponticoccus marisrubri]KUF11594.1 GDSL family lipase [Pseudoponticoccus marisrubri]